MRGFTLVEMLVAIALLGLLGVISWRGLDYVAGQRERIDRDTEELSRILRVLSQLERDVAQRVPDVMLPAPSAPGLLPASIAIMAATDGGVELEIVRIAPRAGGPARAQRVVYRIAELRAARAFPGIGSRTVACPQGRVPLECVEEAKATPNPLFRRIEVRVYVGADRDRVLVELIGILPRES